MSNDLITLDSFKIEITPAVVTANFAEMRGLVDKTVNEHKALVTEETIPDCKSLIANFRKTAKALGDSWKLQRLDATRELMASDEEVKAMCMLLEQAAKDMADQVKAFEDETKAICQNMLSAYLDDCWENQGVQPEFRKASIDDLVKLGSLNTKRTDLSNSAKQAVKDRVAADLALQTQTQARLIFLENACLKNDITPLTRASVEQVLFASDTFFYAQVDNLIAAELNRKADAEERLRKKLAAEQEKAIADALARQKAEDEAKQRDATREMERHKQEEANRLAAEKVKEIQQNQGAVGLTHPVTVNALISFEWDSNVANETFIKANIEEKLKQQGYAVSYIKITPRKNHDQ